MEYDKGLPDGMEWTNKSKRMLAECEYRELYGKSIEIGVNLLNNLSSMPIMDSL